MVKHFISSIVVIKFRIKCTLFGVGTVVVVFQMLFIFVKIFDFNVFEGSLNGFSLIN